MRRTYSRERYLALVGRAARRDPGPRADDRPDRRLPRRDRGGLPGDARGGRGGGLRRRLHVRLLAAAGHRGGRDARPGARGREARADRAAVDVVQRVAGERNRERVGRVEEVLVEGPSRTDPALLRGRTRRNTTVNFAGTAAPGELVDVADRGRDLDDAAGHAARGRCRLTATSPGTAASTSATSAAMPTEDGGETRFGAIVRADSVQQLTDAGWQALVAYGVRTVVDLRGDDELRGRSARRAAGRGRARPASWRRARPSGRRSPRRSRPRPPPRRTSRPRRATSTSIFLERFRENVAAARRARSRDAPEGGVVVHCVGGKDRTGLVTRSCSTSPASPTTRSPPTTRSARSACARGTRPGSRRRANEEERARLHRISQTPAASMIGVFRELERRYGSVEGYLRRGGVDATTSSSASARAAAWLTRPRDLRADRVGQERGRRGDRRADPGRARLGRRDAGLPRPADPHEPVARPTRLVGDLGRSTHEASVGEYQRLAHAAIDEILAAGRTPVVVGGTGLYLRAALADLELPPPPAPGARERWERLYDSSAPSAPTRCSPSAIRRPRPPSTRTTAGASSARSSSPRPARRCARARTGSGRARRATRRSSSGSTSRARSSTGGSRSARARCSSAGVEEEVRRALAGPISPTARASHRPRRDRRAPARARRSRRSSRGRRRYAAYQRKWLRRIPGPC